MKRRQLLISAAAILIAGSAQAASDDPQKPTLSGLVGVYGGGTSFYSQDARESIEGVVGGEAAVNLWMSSMWSVQVDAQAESTTELDDANQYRAHVSAGGHVTIRNPDSYAVGVFGGAAYSQANEWKYMNRWAAGIEGQLYLNDVTLYLQGGYSRLDSGSDVHSEPINGPFGRVVARWFPTPYDKVQAEGSYFYSEEVQAANQGPVHDYEWGLLYEHMFMSAPVSAFAKYAGYSYNDRSHGDEAREDMGLIGFKLYLNQKDLKSNDRVGATLETPVWRGLGAEH